MKAKGPGTPGRPREFDRDEALDIATRLFCKHGFEGVSIADLTEAMHISPPSLYAAFGSKERLYREALAFYLRRADLPKIDVRQPVRDQVRQLLHEAVRAATDPDFPAGCMVTAGLLNCGAEHEALAETVARLRDERRLELIDYLRQAAARGDLPRDADTEAIARYITALMQGIAIQAQDGATPAELFALADVAVSHWPVFP